MIRYLDSGVKTFDLDLPTRGVVLGSELRNAVAARVGRRKEKVELEQLRAKRSSDGAAVVLVGARTGFADEQGERTEEWEAKKRHVIRDGEAVPEAGQLRAFIECYFK